MTLGDVAHEDQSLPAGLPYRVVSLLGRGSTADVYRAEHLTHGGQVAVKVFRRPLAAPDAERFRSECELQWQLSDHPNVVRLLEASTATADRPWAVMQLHEFSLADARPQSPRWDADARARWALDLLHGLSAVHAAGHLHRDVKPSNVLVKDGVAALSDFGCALDVGDRVTDRMTGTPGYLAPELVAGGSPSTRSDVYSAAVTIAQVLGADRPAAVDNVLTRATSHDPGDRPGDAGAFLVALQGALEGAAAPVAGTASTATRATERRERAAGRSAPAARRSGLLFPLAVVLAVVVGGAGAVLARGLLDGAAVGATGTSGAGRAASAAPTVTSSGGGAGASSGPSSGSSAGSSSGVATSAAPGPVELPRLPTSAEDDVRPRSDGAPTSIDVRNRSTQPVRVYWRDFSGTRVLLDTVAPGRGTRISARDSFTFVFTDLGDRPLFVVVAAALPGQVDLAAV